MSKVIFLSLVCCLTSWVCRGQETKYGGLSGGFETNTVFYIKDHQTGALRPDDHFGSNNYLNVDYRWRKFSAGLMYEAYLPVLQGFSNALNDCDITYKYVAFEDKGLKIRVGDFYEQFGSGLVFRAYEERSLGLNTSVEGVQLFYTYLDKISVKAIYGRPRKYLEHASSSVRGIDLSLNLSRCLDWQATNLQLEGSFLNRYEEYVGNREIKSNVDAYSARVYWERSGFSFRGEYVSKTADPALYNDYNSKAGKALLLEGEYVQSGLGISLNLRSLNRMVFRSSREAAGFEEALNYLPALTRQHTYALANLHPYTTRGNGETGGQLDLYYHVDKNTALGGRYGWKMQVNFSTYYTLKSGDFCSVGDELLFRDVNVELTKKWSPAWKSVFFYSMQDFNPLVLGREPGKIHAHILVGDITYKWRSSYSLRMEVQHLRTRQDESNWVAGLVELGVAPSWNLFVSDMYNYGMTGLHYYSGGFSYSRSRTRIALNYGRSRAGYQCAGGVCRDMPAYTGFNLALTSSF